MIDTGPKQSAVHPGEGPKDAHGHRLQAEGIAPARSDVSILLPQIKGNCREVAFRSGARE
jgi:hypothetical protein